jgi:hypothetical protein
VVEDGWRVSQKAVAQDEARTAIRRLRLPELCATQIEGSMTLEEKDFCARFWGDALRAAQQHQR